MVRVGRKVSFLFAAFLTAVLVAPQAGAGEGVDGPVFLVISLNGGTFASADMHCKCKGCVSKNGTCHDNRCGCKKPKNGMPKCCQGNCHLPAGSPIIVIPIGAFLAGYAVEDTRFSQGTDTLEGLIDALTALDKDLSFLHGVQYTIIGAIDTSGPNSIHLLTEDEGAIEQPVQDACFESGPLLEATLLETNDAPTTTVELADYIQLNQDDPTTGAGIQEIYDELFVEPADSTLDYHEDPDGTGDMLASVDAEGSLFPHEPGDAVIDFSLVVDSNGGFVVDTKMEMTIDIKPGNDANPINIVSQGVTPVAILSTVAKDSSGNTIYDAVTGAPKIKFDAPAWVDPSTATILGVYAEDGMTSAEDVNGDGADDLVLHFDTQLLVAAGLGEDTTELEMIAQGFENELGFRAGGTFTDSDVVDAFSNSD